MKKIFALFVSSLALVAASQVVKYELSLESDKYKNTDLDRLFSQYCGRNVERISTEIPEPNYEDGLVKAAVEKLNTVAPVSFYMYGAVVKSYGFRRGTDNSFPWNKYEDIISMSKNRQFGQKKDWSTGTSAYDEATLRNKFDYEYFNPDKKQPSWVKGNTHAFLTYLCGEFRDRPTLIKEKLEWMTNMIKLPVPAGVKTKVDAQAVKDFGKSIWQYVTAEDYAYYVTFSKKAFQAKEDVAWENGAARLMKLSDKWSVDKPVPAFTVCEVKYMVTEYISQPNEADRLFPGYDAYMDGLAQYRESYCTADDTDYYYDFRGDSNMKPNSPESNGMIWHATSIMGRCQRDHNGKVSVKQTKNSEGKWVNMDFDVQACEDYMSRPFASRWNAARAALTTWTLRHQKHDVAFHDTKSPLSIVPTLMPEHVPASFKLHGPDVYSGSDLTNFMDAYGANVVGNWLSPDAGYTSVFGISPSGVEEIDYAYERLKNAVDRHTDWYASGYDDSNLEPQRARVIGQAYSPFVASSYEMSESDAFTAPGITVNGPVDGRRQWMFVFKVHKDKWYNTTSLKEGKEINFETQWFDETSFGTTRLADTERAWDRLGTPLEGEMESILYLHNIMNEGSAIKHMSSPSQYPAIQDDNLGETQ